MQLSPTSHDKQAPLMNDSQNTYPFSFHGTAGEYFRIWIVNTFLTLITLGIYGAWAKVRTQRYFHGNTRLDNASLDYHAKPLQILKGRLILAAGLVVYFALSQFYPGAEIFLLLVVFLLVPWLLVSALRFRMRNTSYRNIRFDFAGSIGESYWVTLRGGLVTLFTLGIGTFWADWLRSCFIVNNLRYGRADFQTEARPTQFWFIYLKMFGMLLLFIGSISLTIFALAFLFGEDLPMDLEPGNSSGIMILLFIQIAVVLVMLPLNLFFFTYLQVRKFNLLAQTSKIDAVHSLQSNLKVLPLFGIYLTNIIAIIFSVGLLIPWAKIRVARYRMQQLALLTSASLDEVIAGETQKIAATGEEVGDYVDVDLGF